MKNSLETVTLGQKKLLDEAGTITVMGDSELTGEQITAWFEARGVHYQLSGDTTIGELADLFVEEGAAEHVRGDIAFAQAILETGSFGHATDNNYGGIGACDSCNGEIAFPTPRDGVRGQIQMLKNYADPESRAANLANPPSAPIYGRDPVSSARCLRHVLREGPRAHVEPHGQRQLGDRAGVRPESARPLLRDGRLGGAQDLIRTPRDRAHEKSWVKQRSSIVPSTRSR